MCNAFLGSRDPAHQARRPLRNRNQPLGTDAGGPEGRRLGHDGGTPSAADALAVTEIGQNSQPFIACAADAVVSVAMSAAAERAARIAQDVSLQ